MLEPLLLQTAPLRQVGDSLFSVLPPGDAGARFDRIAAAYDRAVASPAYLKIAWGTTREDNARFIRRAFESGNGPIVDIAAGSCVDSVAVYAATARPTIVLDRSIAMLRRGIERLEEVAGSVPAHVVFLQADAMALPFADGSLETVLCHFAYHLFPETAKLVAEWQRVIGPGGAVFASSLIRGRWIGDRYLNLLHRSGEVGKPLTAAEFAARLQGELGTPVELEAKGSCAFARSPSA